MAWGAYAVSVICIGASVYLMIREKEGWGWLLFIAFLALNAAVESGQ